MSEVGRPSREPPGPALRAAREMEARGQQKAGAHPVPASPQHRWKRKLGFLARVPPPFLSSPAPEPSLGEAGLPDHPQPFLRNADASTLLPGAGQRQAQGPPPPLLSSRRFLFAQIHPQPQGSPLCSFLCCQPLPVLAPEARTQGERKQARPGHRVSAGRPARPQRPTSRPGLPDQQGRRALRASPPSPAPSVPLHPA